jgi:uncharacterized protein
MIKVMCVLWITAIFLVTGAFAADEAIILTGGTSGVYYPLGQAVKVIFDREIPNQKFSAMSTQATVENLNLLQQGRGVLALAQGDILAEAWKGNPEAGFPSSRTKIRMIGAAYPNYIHVVARKDANIHSIEALKGKRISVGAARSGNELNARALLNAAGMSYADLGEVEYLEYGATVDLITKGQLDAAIISAGLGVPAVTRLANQVPTDIVPLPADIAEKTNGMFYPMIIPANSYPGQSEDVRAAALNNFFVTSSDVPDDLVYRMTKAIFDHVAELRTAHPAASAINKENALVSRPIRLHPGAEKYFKEEHILQ